MHKESTMPSTAESLRDLQIVRRRLLRPLLTPVDCAEAKRLSRSIGRGGHWPDVDYRDMSTVNWRPMQHLTRLGIMARAFVAPGSELRESAPLGKAISRGLDYWLKHDFRRPWWYEEIGTPMAMSQILLLMDGHLLTEQREGGIEILKRSRLTATGQNLVWLSSIVARRGILQRDPGVVAEAYRYIAGEIRISKGEGVQHDFSFHQHGPCLYNHGYGAGFASDCARLAVLVSGTQFAFPPDRVEILTRYILDGSQWFARGPAPEYGAKGREITRRGASVRYLSQASRNLMRLPTGRRDELEALARRSAGRQAPPLVGNRHFWRSDIMAHHRPAYYASARMHSVRNVNTDGLSGCEEGLRSHHLADGTSYLYRTGREYVDIFPAWDWQRVPGTTVELGPAQSGEPRRKGTTAFVGGVSNGMYGLAAFDFERDGLRARKSWFFFDSEYVCLGAGISCSSRAQVVTTLNQCHLRGRVTVAGGGRPHRLEMGDHSLEGPAWVHHDRVAYVFPQGPRIGVRTGVQTGSWKEISNQSSAETVSHEVFSAWIEHGEGQVGQGYAYAVVPGMPVSGVRAYAERPPFDISSNTPGLQAVRHRRLRICGLAFYQPGEAQVSRSLTLRADRACLVLVRELRGGVELSVANPRNRKLTVALDLNRELKGEGARKRSGGRGTRVTFHLPGGPLAGQSVTRTLSQR